MFGVRESGGVGALVSKPYLQVSRQEDPCGDEEDDAQDPKAHKQEEVRVLVDGETKEPSIPIEDVGNPIFDGLAGELALTFRGGWTDPPEPWNLYQPVVTVDSMIHDLVERVGPYETSHVTRMCTFEVYVKRLEVKDADEEGEVANGTDA